jgi:hypothetical protein
MPLDGQRLGLTELENVPLLRAEAHGFSAASRESVGAATVQ